MQKCQGEGAETHMDDTEQLQKQEAAASAECKVRGGRFSQSVPCSCCVALIGKPLNLRALTQ